MAPAKEYLLIPRYKVKDKYPGMELEPFYVGQIITLQWHREEDDDDCAEGYVHVPNKHMPRSFMWQSFFDLFPNIFEPLPWWSDRKVEEMPEYVRCIKTPDQIIMPGEVFKVIWNDNGSGKVVENGPWIFPYTNCYEPSSNEEYINQKQQ